ncbi:hypothetical protein [Burkholderia sp. IDO3]|uniref:hypothetical protein n=1 Tax=Burkholderia sp. IDO3 TaxID=1705310 RepID=UPI0011776655|nr:hypothetical protein [Burkholderia sp. IDO3]
MPSRVIDVRDDVARADCVLFVAAMAARWRSPSTADPAYPTRFDGRFCLHSTVFSVVSLKSPRRDFPLAHRLAHRVHPIAAIPAKSRTAAPPLAFASFARFRGNRAFLPVFDALPKVWKSAQKMYLEPRNWIDTLQPLYQRRQPRRSGIEPAQQARQSMAARPKFAVSFTIQSG